MFEFLIGTRFYYKGKLVEVKDNTHGEPCSNCIFKPIRNNLYCKQNCDPDDRHDGKYVIFKEVRDDLRCRWCWWRYDDAYGSCLRARL